MTSGEASIITELVAKVAALIAQDDEREKTRAELRKKDDHWRDRMETKTDGIYKTLDDVTHRLDELPATIDQRVRDEIAEHRDDDAERQKLTRSLAIMAAVAVVLAVAATMKFVDHHEAAGVVYLVLAGVAPFVIALFMRGH